MKKNWSKGFTIVETMTVVAMIAIITAISVPLIQKTLIGYSLSSDMQLMMGAINRARLESMKLGTFTAVTFTPNPGGEASYVAFIDANRDGIADPGETVIQSGTFHTTSIMGNRTFVSSLNGGNSIQFNSLGFPFGVDAGGNLMNYSGTIDASCVLDSKTTIYQRLTIAISGKPSIQKQETPFI